MRFCQRRIYKILLKFFVVTQSQPYNRVYPVVQKCHTQYNCKYSVHWSTLFLHNIVTAYEWISHFFSIFKAIIYFSYSSSFYETEPFSVGAYSSNLSRACLFKNFLVIVQLFFLIFVMIRSRINSLIRLEILNCRTSFHNLLSISL